MTRLIAIVFFILSLVAPHVAVAEDEEGAQKLEILASLWCDTADQLETVLRAHYTDKVPLPRAMAEINRFSPEACIIARAIINPGTEVKRVTAGDVVMSLRAARVHGIMRGVICADDDAADLVLRPRSGGAGAAVVPFP